MKQRINLDELIVGQPLPWDAYDQDGSLLLRKGEIVPTQRAVDRLIEDGLFAQKEELSAHKQVSVDEEKPSALQLIMDARRTLTKIFRQIPESPDDFVSRVDKLNISVRCACDAHPEVCLASILLMQDGAYTVRHPINAAILAYILAKELALDEEKQHSTVAAALTMNLGMYEVQEKIDTIRGPLNEKLMSMIKKHPALGVECLVKRGVKDPVWLTIVQQHHENRDGSGYPGGFSNDDIDIGARILGFADKYCAMVSVHGYRPPHKPNTALRDLYTKLAQQLDPGIVNTMIRVVGIYPVGTLVRLKTAEIAVVTGPGNGPDTPAVHAVTARSGMQLEVASHRKTHLSEFAIEGVLTVDKLSVPVRMASIWGKDAKLG